MPFRSSRSAAVAALALAFSLPVVAEELGGVPVTVLARSVVEVPNGTVTYLRIRPPVLPTRPVPPPSAPAPQLSPEMQAAIERAALKTYATLALTITVYTRADDSVAISKLTWTFAERSFTAWSTADFRLLRQLTDIETETHRFQYFPFVDTQVLSELPTEQQPVGLALFPLIDDAAGALPEYRLEGGEITAAAAEPVLAALDWLHAHYHLHRSELAADLARREAEAAERAREQAAAAALPKHEKIYFWKIQ